MKKRIDFRRDPVQLMKTALVVLAVVVSLTGCGGSGGGGGSSTAAATSGSGRGSVTVRVPFAGSTANSSKLQAAFPSSVNHVEIELFGAGMEPTIATGTHDNNSVTFPDVPLGEKWLLFLAVNDSSTILTPNGTFSAQRVRGQSISPSRIFSMAAVRVDVLTGNNVVDTVTIGGVFNSSSVFGSQRTISGVTGLEFIKSDNTGTERELVVADSTGVQDAGTLNNAETAFVQTNTPVGNAMIIPSPLGGFVGDFSHNQVSGNNTTAVENCHRVIELVGTESVALPGGTTNVLHLRTTDTCTPVGGGSVRKRIRDQWIRTAAGAIGTSAPIGLVLLTKREESNSNTSGNMFSSDEIRVLTNSTASNTPLNGPLGSDLLIGPGTAWNFIGVATSPGGSVVGSSGTGGGGTGGTGGGTALSTAFFPLAPGDVHEYRRTNPDNSTENRREETGSPTTPAGFSSQVTPINRFDVVGSTATLSNVDFFTADSVNGIQHFGEQEFFNSTSCVFKDTPPQQVPNGLTVGQSSAIQNIAETVISGTCTGGGAGTFRATLEAIENVTVPAGTFSNCLRLRLDMTDSFGTETNTLWLAQGIGVVKQTTVTNNLTTTEVLTFAQIGNTTVGTQSSFSRTLSRVVRPQQSRPQLRRARLRW